MGAAIGLGAVLMLASMQARAGDPAVDLTWDAPATCPGGDAVTAEIESLLAAVGSAPPDGGSDGPETPPATAPEAPTADPVQAHGRVRTADAQAWAIDITLTLDGEATERHIEGRSCEELSSAAAFIIAMAVDPRVATVPLPSPSPSPTAEESETSSEPAPNPEVVPEVVPKVVPEPEPEPELPPSEPVPEAPSGSESDEPAAPADRPRRVGASLGLLAGGGFGPTPGLAAALGALGGVRGYRWRVDAWGQYWTPSTETSDTNPSVGVRVQAFALGLRGCWVPEAGARVELPLCAGLGAGGLHGRGTGDLRISRNAVVPWIHALGGLGVLVRLGARLAVGARVDGHAMIAGGAFRTEPSGRLGSPRAGGLTAAARVEFRLR